MKVLTLTTALGCLLFVGSVKGQNQTATVAAKPSAPEKMDSLKMKIDGTMAYYQKTVKVDTMPEGLIYLRAVEFLAAKNMQQNYGDDQEGKLIYTTAQDLNINAVYVSDEGDIVQPYTAQFAITVDLKNGGYRYTIHNIVIYKPEESGNKRQNLYDLYLKSTTAGSKRIARDAKKLIDSFEAYLTSLTNELYDGIKQQSAIYDPKF